MIFQKSTQGITITVNKDFSVVITNEKTGQENRARLQTFVSNDTRKVSGISIDKTASWLGTSFIPFGPETKAEIEPIVNAIKPVEKKRPVSLDELKAQLAETEAAAEKIEIDDENAKHLNRVKQAQLRGAIERAEMTDEDRARLAHQVKVTDWILSGEYDDE